MDPETRQLVGHMFKVLENPVRRLTEWELEFLDSTREQFEDRGSLSERQLDVLNRIYREKTA